VGNLFNQLFGRVAIFLSQVIVFFFPILYRNPSVLLGESEWLLVRDQFLLSLIQRCITHACLRKKKLPLNIVGTEVPK